MTGRGSIRDRLKDPQNRSKFIRPKRYNHHIRPILTQSRVIRVTRQRPPTFSSRHFSLVTFELNRVHSRLAR